MIIIQKYCGLKVEDFTTEQFAEKVLKNPGKVFNLFLDPDSTVFFFLASVDIFGSQTIIINAARFINKDSIIGEPGATYASSLHCYDTYLKACCTWNDCMEEVIEELNRFKTTFKNTDSMWYVVEDGEVHTLEIICH